jgi:hypothetical protein
VSGSRHLADLCVTRSEVIHLILSCEVYRSGIVQRILDSLRMVTSVCYLVMLPLVYLSFVVRQRNPIVLHHTNIGHVIGEQQGYTTKIMNGRYMRASVTR